MSCLIIKIQTKLLKYIQNMSIVQCKSVEDARHGKKTCLWSFRPDKTELLRNLCSRLGFTTKKKKKKKKTTVIIQVFVTYYIKKYVVNVIKQ